MSVLTHIFVASYPDVHPLLATGVPLRRRTKKGAPLLSLEAIDQWLALRVQPIQGQLVLDDAGWFVDEMWMDGVRAAATSLIPKKKPR